MITVWFWGIQIKLSNQSVKENVTEKVIEEKIN